VRRKRNPVRRIAAAAVSMVAGGALLLNGSPAQAANFDGNCQSGEICLFWGTGYTGSMADYYDDVADYNGLHFWASASWLDNNSMSAKSRTSFYCTWLYQFPKSYGPGNTGVHFTPGQNRSDLGWMNNQGSSHDFLLC